MINDCVWCGKYPLKGDKSNLYQLCSECRNSKEGKVYITSLDKNTFEYSKDKEQQLDDSIKMYEFIENQTKN